MEFEPLHPTFGALVTGLDPHAPDDDPQWDDFRAAFAGFRLLAVDLPELSDEAHVVLIGQLGPTVLEGVAERRAHTFVSNVRPDGVLADRAAAFHIDFGFFPDPYDAISLYGVELPPGGTETWFADAIAAADDLPDELRRRVTGRTARHVIDIADPRAEAIVRVRVGRLDDSYPHTRRPVLWPHPTSGREILAVWEQQTDAIDGYDEQDSTELIEALFAHLYRPENTLAIAWRPGRLIVWDNRALQHGRPRVAVADGARTLRRVCVGRQQDLSAFATYAGRAPRTESTPS